MCQQLESSLRGSGLLLHNALSNFGRSDESSWSMDAYNREFQRAEEENGGSVKVKELAKAKKRQKPIEEILGIPKVGYSNKGARKINKRRLLCLEEQLLKQHFQFHLGGLIAGIESY